MSRIETDWRNARLYKPNVRITKEPPNYDLTYRPRLTPFLISGALWALIAWGFWKVLGR